MSGPDLKKACKEMGSGFAPIDNTFVVAHGPGKDAHQTFQVDTSGEMSNLHTTEQISKKNIKF